MVDKNGHREMVAKLIFKHLGVEGSSGGRDGTRCKEGIWERVTEGRFSGSCAILAAISEVLTDCKQLQGFAIDRNQVDNWLTKIQYLCECKRTRILVWLK